MAAHSAMIVERGLTGAAAAISGPGEKESYFDYCLLSLMHVYVLVYSIVL